MYSSNPRRVGIYNTYTWASIHMGSIYSNNEASYLEEEFTNNKTISGHWADTMHRMTRVGAQGRIGRCEGGDYY